MRNKLINMLIIILIMLALIPLNINASEGYVDIDAIKTNKNASIYEIVDYWKNTGESFADVQTAVLVKWYDTIVNKKGDLWDREFTQQVAYYRQNALFVKTEIKSELESRGVDLNNYVGMDNLDYWKPTAQGDHTKLTTLVGKILGVIQVVGTVISVVVLAILGIKYMFASLEQKATYKQTTILYVVGCVMVFAISNIVKIIYDISTNLTNLT